MEGGVLGCTHGQPGSKLKPGLEHPAWDPRVGPELITTSLLPWLPYLWMRMRQPSKVGGVKQLELTKLLAGLGSREAW